MRWLQAMHGRVRENIQLMSLNDKEDEYETCEICGHPIPRGTKVCPNCGYCDKCND